MDTANFALYGCHIGYKREVWSKESWNGVINKKVKNPPYHLQCTMSHGRSDKADYISGSVAGHQTNIQGVH